MIMRRLMHMKTILLPFFFCILSMAFLTAGNAETINKKGGRNWKRLNNKQVDLHRYLKENIKPNWTYQLDLSDDRQYAYVLHMLELSGDSPKKSPELYRRLTAANVKKKNRKTTKPILDAAAATSNTGQLVPLNLIDSFYNNPTTNTYITSALSSYPNGTNYTKITVNLAYQKSGTTAIFANNAANTTQFAQGENFRVAVTGTLPSDATSKDVTANVLILTEPGDHSCDKYGGICSYISRRQMSSLPVNGCLQKPIYKAKQGQNLCTNQLPNIGADNLTMCYYRGSGSSSDCDYWSSTPHPPQYTFPIQGNASFMANVSSVENVTLTLQRSAGGGGCMLCGSNSPGLCPNSSGVITPSNVTISGPNLSWDWSNAGFPNTSDCVIQSGGDDTWFNLEMFVQLSTGDFTSAQFATEHTGMAQAPQFPMPKVEILDGCLAKGTKITMQDGTEMAIEEFRGGKTEHVRSDREGKIRAVLGNTRGTEPIPIVYIEDKSGKRLLLTEGHPVVTVNGIVVAGNLKVGDKVITSSGPSALTKVGREKYDGEIRNLKLEGTDSEVNEGKTTLFANGILVGDTRMQKQMKKASLKMRANKTTAQILKALPEEWHQDYKNYMQSR